MSIMTPCLKNDPLMIAWNNYKLTPEYQNSKKWATNPDHVDGSLWAVFEAGFKAAMEASSPSTTAV